MLLLAIESATDVAAVALADDRGVVAHVALARGRRHAETLAPAVSFACRSAGIALGDLDAVGVDVGPGLFTGLRVGLATAKALAFALGVPLVEAGSLEVLALGAARCRAPGGTGLPLLIPVVDARRGEVFSARFRAVGTGSAHQPARGTGSAVSAVSPVGEEGLWSPEALAADLAGLDEPCLCLGDGARRYRDLLESVPGVEVAGPGATHPDVAALAALTLSRAVAGLGRPPSAVGARYLRPADVRINWEQRAPARPAGGR